MTGPPDPVEQWLSRDVELLSPPPGAFDRVHHNARRRRTVRAMSTAAGAAVVIVAAVIVPQVARGLLPGGNGPGQANIGGTTTPPVRHPSGTATASPSPTRHPHRAASHGPALVSAGTGPAVAAGFRPTSVTFAPASGGVIGAALGRTGARCAAPCTVMAGTANYGRTWTRIGAPAAGAPDGSAGVSQVRFRDTSNGWAYGPALYATHDGGIHWRLLTLPGRVIDLSTVGTMAFAVVATCTGSGTDFAAHCTGFALYQTPVAADQWTRVAGGASASTPASPGGLQLTGAGGYLLASGRLYAGPVDGGAWHRVKPTGTGSAAPPCLARTGQAAAGTALIAPSGGDLFLACGPGQLTLYSSADGGQAWQRAGQIAARGSAKSLSAIPGGAIVLATTKGLYYSADATTWHRAKLTGAPPAGGFAFVGMTNTLQGVAVPAGQAPRVLYVTQDGGQTWQATSIR